MFTYDKVHPFKLYISVGFSIFTVVQPLLFQNIFLTSKRNSIPFGSLPCCSPGQPQIYFLSLRSCIFGAFHVNGIIQYVAFCAWLLSLSITFSRSTHIVVGSVLCSFLWLSNILLLWIDHILFMHLSGDGHLRCFHFLALRNNTAMDVSILVFVWTCIFKSLWYIPRSRTAVYMVTLCLTF